MPLYPLDDLLGNDFSLAESIFQKLVKWDAISQDNVKLKLGNGKCAHSEALTEKVGCIYLPLQRIIIY
jgi:hypothetical protein